MVLMKNFTKTRSALNSLTEISNCLNNLNFKSLTGTNP